MADISPPRANYDSDTFSLDINVEEYSPEDLHIKTEADVLVISAKKENKTPAGKTYVSKQFEQRFTLPSGVNPEKISSKLGADGVLRISAPRENVSYKRPEALEHGRSGSISSKASEGLPEPQIKYEKDKLEIKIDVSEYSPEDLDLRVEGSHLIITAKQDSKEGAGTTKSRVFEQKFSLPPGVRTDTVRSNLSREGFLVITASKESDSLASLENKMDRVMSPGSWEPKHQSAFDDVRRDSSTDERRIMSAFDDLRRDSTKAGSSMFDRGSLFDDKSIFASNSEQSGVSHVEYDDKNYKIIVNVEKYKPEELFIRTVDNTVIVEAKHEEKTSDGRSCSTQSFSQSFTLPAGVDPDTVKSGLSKQGVLTISAPVVKTNRANQGRLVPIKHI